MRVKILKDGLYSRFEGDKAHAQRLEAEEVVDYPAWYARSLVDSGAAAFVVEISEVPQQVTAEVGATDAARALAEERGVDLAAVKGTGKDGKITLKDIKAAL